MELLWFVRRAVWRDRYLPDAKHPSPIGEQGTEIDLGCRCVGPSREPFGDFITYFITCTANTYATMHYDVSWSHPAAPERGDATIEHPRRHSPPPGMEQRDHATVRRHEVHRHAVGHRHCEQHAGLSRGVAVHSLDDQPH